LKATLTKMTAKEEIEGMTNIDAMPQQSNPKYLTVTCDEAHHEQ
jgi:hypothetical protein